MSSTTQDKSFKKAIGDELPQSLLGTAVDWIRDNMNPDQVFDEARLNKFVGNTAKVDEVFDEDELHKWAEEHGYKKQNILSELNQ